MIKTRIKTIILFSTLLFAVAVMMLPIPALADCDASIGETCGCDAGVACGGGEGTCRITAPADTPTCQRNETAAADTGTSATTASPLAPRLLPNPMTGVTTIPELLGRVITMFTGIAGSIALLMFVYGGVMWLISGGSEERVKAGKQAITWATIGLFVIFGSYAILRVIFLALGARL